MELARTALNSTTVLMAPIRKYARQIHPRLTLKHVQLRCQLIQTQALRLHQSSTPCPRKKRGSQLRPLLVKRTAANKLFMAGVRDPRHDVAPAAKHGGSCEFRTFR